MVCHRIGRQAPFAPFGGRRRRLRCLQVERDRRGSACRSCRRSRTRCGCRAGSARRRSAARVHVDLLDARLVLVDRLFAVDLGARRGDVVVRREHQVVDPAAEVGPLDPLAGRGAEDDEDRLADVLLERELDTPPLRLTETGNRSPLPRKSRSFAIVVADRSGLKATLDELLALAARDSRRVLDLFDRERTMIAKRTADLARPSCGDHVEHILPSDQGFLVHRESPFVSTPSNADAIVGNRARRGQRVSASNRTRPS